MWKVIEKVQMPLQTLLPILKRARPQKKKMENGKWKKKIELLYKASLIYNYRVFELRWVVFCQSRFLFVFVCNKVVHNAQRQFQHPAKRVAYVTGVQQGLCWVFYWLMWCFAGSCRRWLVCGLLWHHKL